MLYVLGLKAIANYLIDGIWGRWVLLIAILYIASNLADALSDALERARLKPPHSQDDTSA